MFKNRCAVSKNLKFFIQNGEYSKYEVLYNWTKPEIGNHKINNFWQIKTNCFSLWWQHWRCKILKIF